MRKVVFSVYLTNNSINNKPKFQSSKYRETLAYFKNCIEKNKKEIIFPLQYTSNSKEVRLDRFYLLFVREDDVSGRQIIKHQEFLIEEKFYVYGLKKRLTVMQILEHLLKKFNNNFTLVRMFKNKIVFECGDDIECILTKNTSDCQRLYLFLKTFYTEKKIKGLIFAGKVPNKSKKMKSELIQKLVDFTGLSHYQFKRQSTRH
jgi:hypothetical protein